MFFDRHQQKVVKDLGKYHRLRTGNRIIVDIAGRTLLDEAFADAIHPYEQQNDPEERVPGFGGDYLFKGKVGNKNGRKEIKQNAIQNVLLL